MSDIPQLLVGCNDPASLILNSSVFDTGRINLNGNTGIALEITGNVNLNTTSTLNVINGNVNIGISGNSTLHVGTTGFLNTLISNESTTINEMYIGSKNSKGSFKFILDIPNEYLKIYKWNNTLGTYELSMRLEHFC